MNHKYGFHCNRTGDDILDAARRLQPKIVKVMDANVGFLRQLRDTLPNAMLIGRLYVTNNEQSAFVQDPKGNGIRYADRCLATEASRTLYKGKPLVDAWETYNEVFPQSVGAETKKKYDDFQVAFAQRLRAGGSGLEPIAMNFATGNMLSEDFLNYFPGTLDSYTYLGFHEYDWPDMWRLHWQNIQEKHEGGMFLTLRYRRIMRDVRGVYGDKHRVIMTECGMTQGVQGGPDVGPWDPSHPIAEQRYWDSLMWYNYELMRDPYVLGALLFVVGAVTPWHSFEHLGGMINRLVDFQSSAKAPYLPMGAPPPADADPTVGGVPIPTPPPAPTPPPVPVINPPGPTLESVLKEEAARKQVIQFNPGAALQKVIFAAGFVPNSGEFDLENGGVKYIAQRSEHLGSGEVRVYYVPVGDWGNVKYVVDASAPGSRGLPPMQDHPKAGEQIV